MHGHGGVTAYAVRQSQSCGHVAVYDARRRMPTVSRPNSSLAGHPRMNGLVSKDIQRSWARIKHSQVNTAPCMIETEALCSELIDGTDSYLLQNTADVCTMCTMCTMCTISTICTTCATCATRNPAGPAPSLPPCHARRYLSERVLTGAATPAVWVGSPAGCSLLPCCGLIWCSLSVLCFATL